MLLLIFEAILSSEMSHYAVTWRNGSGLPQVGRLDVEAHGVRFEGGRHRSGRLAVSRLLYRDFAQAAMAPRELRVQDRPTIELQGKHGSVYVAPVGAGLAREVLRLLRRGMDMDRDARES